MTPDKSFALRAVPGLHSSYPGIQLAGQINNSAAAEDLQFLQQLGIEWVMVGVSDDANQHTDYYKALVTRFAEYGLQIYRISDHRVHNVPEITLNLPGRDQKVEDLCTFIRNIGAAGGP